MLDALIAGVNIVELDPEETASATAACRTPTASCSSTRAACTGRRSAPAASPRSKACARRRSSRRAVMDADRPSPDRRQGRAGVRAQHWASRSRTTSTPRRSRAAWLDGSARPIRCTTSIRSSARRRCGASSSQMIARGADRPEPLLRHDQLRRRQREGRGLRRDDDERPGVEDSRPRRRLADPRRRPLRRQRSRRGRIDRPRRGQPLQPLLVPDRRGDAPRRAPEGRRHGGAQAHQGEHDREAAAATAAASRTSTSTSTC